MRLHRRDREARNNKDKEDSARAQNTLNSINSSRFSGATSGDYRVINGSRALIREYERQMQSIQQ